MVDRVANVDIPNCKKILPLVYADSLSYYEQLCKFVAKLEEVIEFCNNLTDEILGEAKAYTDEKIAETFADVDEKLAEINQLIADTTREFEELVDDTVRQFNQLINELQLQYYQFTQQITGEVRRIDERITDTNERLDESIEGVNQRTDLMIQLNNEYLIEEIAGNLPNELKVYNILEGDRVTLQEMFDYLCGLHVTDGITVSELVSRELTLNKIIAIDRSVRDVIMYGDSILVP